MALDADAERHAQVERFFVGEAQLSCEFMKPDLGGQSDSLVVVVGSVAKTRASYRRARRNPSRHVALLCVECDVTWGLC
jgi:hypothetical protein